MKTNLWIKSSLNSAKAVSVYAALVCFLAYLSIFAFRKAFNVASFQGFTLWGLDYKVVLVITQVFGYMLSKFVGIRFISELKHHGRGWLILILVGISWLAWLAFALIPPPYNFWCLFLNGFPLGFIWGIVFSYVEGRRATDFIGAALAVSFIFGSGVAKSVAQYLMVHWQISEFWMPFWVGALFALPLVALIYLMEQIPEPSLQDVEHRTLRQPMTKKERKEFMRTFFPGIVLLVIIYILVTVLREVRDGFMADMWRESGEQFEPSVFAITESWVSIIILIIIASLVFVKSNYRAFNVVLWIILAGFVLSGLSSWFYMQGRLTIFTWMTLVGLGLYLVYIPYNSMLFDRFLAAFRYTGTVGFLIYLADSCGYIGSVAVLFTKTIFKQEVNWLTFFIRLTILSAAVGSLSSLLSWFYFRHKYQVHSDTQT